MSNEKKKSREYERVGEEAQYRVTDRNREGYMLIDVEILDYQLQFGHHTYKIKPVDGEGEMWVRSLVFKDDNVRM